MTNGLATARRTLGLLVFISATAMDAGHHEVEAASRLSDGFLYFTCRSSNDPPVWGKSRSLVCGFFSWVSGLPGTPCGPSFCRAISFSVLRCRSILNSKKKEPLPVQQAFATPRRSGRDIRWRWLNERCLTAFHTKKWPLGEGALGCAWGREETRDTKPSRLRRSIARLDRSRHRDIGSTRRSGSSTTTD